MPKGLFPCISTEFRSLCTKGLSCQFCNKVCENWVRLKHDFPLKSGKCAPLTIKVSQAWGLIELHGVTGQGTFILQGS